MALLEWCSGGLEPRPEDTALAIDLMLGRLPYPVETPVETPAP